MVWRGIIGHLTNRTEGQFSIVTKFYGIWSYSKHGFTTF
jgi:hypothetical protein